MIPSPSFFNYVREHLTHGVLTQTQVNTLNAIYDLTPPGQSIAAIAYAMATAFREAGPSLNPSIEERGKGIGRHYGQPGAYESPLYADKAHTDPYRSNYYYGRGISQLTWLDGYCKLGSALQLQLAEQPDLALDPKNSVKILWAGMSKGLFTGKKLSDYITATSHNFVDARRIVNGTDSAAEIAGNANVFLMALQAAHLDIGVTLPPTAAHIEPLPPAPVQPHGLWNEIKGWFHKG